MTFTDLEPLTADVIVDRPHTTNTLPRDPTMIITPLVFITTIILTSAILAYRHRHDENKPTKRIVVLSLAVAIIISIVTTMLFELYWRMPTNNDIYIADHGAQLGETFIYSNGQWYQGLPQDDFKRHQFDKASDAYDVWLATEQDLPSYILEHPSPYKRGNLDEDNITMNVFDSEDACLKAHGLPTAQTSTS